MKLFARVLILLGGFAMSPLSAQVMPFSFGSTPSQDELPLLSTLAEATALLRDDAPAALAKLDAILPALTRPTRFRGTVQYTRAMALVAVQDYEQAVPAVEEAIQLLPDNADPKLLGSFIFTFTGSAGRAADLWIAASRERPDMARLQDAYAIDALIGRLQDAGDSRRKTLIEARLIEIGYPDAADYALDVIGSRMGAGDIVGAQQLIPRITKPVQLAALLSDRRFAALWPNVESWAGTRLERQWPIYLEGAKRRWEASRSLDAARIYATALEEAGDHQMLVEEFQPALASDDDIRTNFSAQFLAPQLATALIATGHVADAFALYARLATLWPYQTDVRGLTISANWAKASLEQGDAGSALQRIDGVIANATARGPEINSSALAAMHMVRACALFDLGRGDAALESVAVVTAAQETNGRTYISMLACAQDHRAARAFLLRALADSERYAAVLALFQPTVLAVRSPYTARDRLFLAKAASDPDVAKAIGKVGRILSFPIAAPHPAS